MAGTTEELVVFVTGDAMGDGEAELGRVLMRSFLKTVAQLDPLPWRVIFVNAGITLTTAGSELLEDLRGLEAQGVELLSCGTCLDYYQRKADLQVGRASNMHEIVTTLAAAGRVLRP
jgi:selenium metabolism protein YedF